MVKFAKAAVAKDVPVSEDPRKGRDLVVRKVGTWENDGKPTMVGIIAELDTRDKKVTRGFDENTLPSVNLVNYTTHKDGQKRYVTVEYVTEEAWNKMVEAAGEQYGTRKDHKGKEHEVLTLNANIKGAPYTNKTIDAKGNEGWVKSFIVDTDGPMGPGQKLTQNIITAQFDRAAKIREDFLATKNAEREATKEAQVEAPAAEAEGPEVG